MVVPDGLIIESERDKAIFKLGIKEVVEWMLPNFLICTDGKSAFANGQISLEKWQAKLKEWGIE